MEREATKFEFEFWINLEFSIKSVKNCLFVSVHFRIRLSSPRAGRIVVDDTNSISIYTSTDRIKIILSKRNSVDSLRRLLGRKEWEHSIHIFRIETILIFFISQMMVCI